MNDISDKILELNKKVEKEITNYIKKVKVVELCEPVFVTDGEYTYNIVKLEQTKNGILCYDYYEKEKVYLDCILSMCYSDIYLEILDCCIKNS